MTFTGICKTKAFQTGVGGSSAIALTILLVFVIPGMENNVDAITELKNTQIQLDIKQQNDQEDIEDLEHFLYIIDNKLDKLTIILCKNSDSNLCN